MVKLKDLLKEGSPGYKNRQFGDPLPTLKDIMKEKKMKDLELGKVYTDSDMPPFKVTEEVVDEATPSKSFFNGFKQLPLYKEMNPNQRQAVSIALIMGGDMTGAVREIEKIKKGLSKNKKVRNALRLANESVEESVDEGEKKQASNIAYKFDQAYMKFRRDIRDITKLMDKSTGSKVDGKIIEKAFEKGLIPLGKLMDEWEKGQQENPGLSEETINEAPEQQMASQLNKISDTILKITNKFKGKADVDGMTRSWMLGLHAKLKKAGIKT